MSRQTIGYLAVGLAIAAIAVFLTLTANQGSHLRLEGNILKVRVLPLTNSGASIVFVDFRATNPSNVPMVVNGTKLRLVPGGGDTKDKKAAEPIDGVVISKSDMDALFQNEKLLGLKYNDVLSLQDRIEPHKTVDRMIGARFEVPEAAINSRKSLTVLIEDVDGATTEIGETAVAQKR